MVVVVVVLVVTVAPDPDAALLSPLLNTRMVVAPKLTEAWLPRRSRSLASSRLSDVLDMLWTDRIELAPPRREPVSEELEEAEDEGR